MSSRLFSFLTGNPSPSKVKHYLVKGSYAENEEMPPAQFLIIDGSGDVPNGKGVYLYRFLANGDCLNDTWHESVEDAKAAADYEYENYIHGWQNIPDEIDDMVNFVVANMRLGSTPERST